MTEQPQYDVFLSHSAKDKAVACPRPVAASRQNAANSTDDEACDGNEDGGALPRRRYAEQPAFGAAQSWPFRFRDPLNRERRFVPLRLDDAPNKGSLGQFLYINWRPSKGGAMVRLVGICDPQFTTHQPGLHDRWNRTRARYS